MRSLLQLIAAAVVAALPAAGLAEDAPGTPDMLDGTTGEILAEPAVTWTEEPAESVFDGDAMPQIEGAPSEEVAVSPRYALQRIDIKGNKKTMRRLILRYVDISPGEVFSADDPRLEMTRYRLLASGYFSRVQLTLKKGDKRGWVVLEVRVKERNTIIIKDFMVGFSEITPYGSIGVQDSSFFGTGVTLGGSAVVSKDQWGYRLVLQDDHFLNTDIGLHIDGLYAHARDFFGHEGIEVDTATGAASKPYAELAYDRAGIRLGTGYTLLLDYFFWIDFRFEAIRAAVPPAGSHYSFGERRPIEFGHLLPGGSMLSSLLFGVARDTRDHPLLPSQGSLTDFGVDLATEVLGSDYQYAKFTLAHDTYFPLGKGHAIRVGFFAGLIMGDAPFFDQFFVGDYSAFIPSRVLELNFSHLQPNLLNTSVQEMRYEDMAGSLNLEYNIPFFRGDGIVYGVNGFVGVGVFALASREHLRTDPKGYQGIEVVPMDLTADLGVKIDTRFGILIFSVANLFRLIPSVGSEMAK
jgi:hypothetical protein